MNPGEPCNPNVPVCPTCQKSDTVEHNGGQWCPTCGIFVIPPSPEIVAAIKSRPRDAGVESPYQTDEGYHANYKRRSLQRLALGIVLIIGCPLLFYLLLPTLAGDLDKSLGNLARHVASGSSQPAGTVVKGVNAIQSAVGFYVMMALAGMGVYFGFVQVAKAAKRLRHQPPKPSKASLP